MSEVFRNDPTKKRGSQGTEEIVLPTRAEQAAADRKGLIERLGPPSGGEIPSPGEQRFKENRQVALKALGALGEFLQQTDNDHAASWGTKREEWGRAFVSSLKEGKGSVPSEKIELVEPMALLAMRAFRRTSPEDAGVEAAEAARDSGHRRLLDKLRVDRNEARQAFGALAERYPEKLSRPDVLRGNFSGLLGKAAERMRGVTAYKDIAERLQVLSRAEGLPALERIGNVDGLLEELADRMAVKVMDHTAAAESGQEYDEQMQTADYAAASEILPQMKSLMDLRMAMCKEKFGHEKSADEVLALQEAMRKAKEATREDEKPPAAVRPKLGALNAGDTAVMRARAEALLRKNGPEAIHTQPPKVERLPRPIAPEIPRRGDAPRERRSETTEQERKEKELLAEILRDGASEITTSFSSDIPGTKGSGFQARSEERFGPARNAGSSQTFLSESRQLIKGRDADELLTSNGVNEVIGLYPAKEDVFENREIEVPKKGLFAFGQKEKRIERVKVGNRPVMHGERVAGGKQEPLVELIYSTVDSPDQGAYRDYSKRTGQFLSVTIRLPESLARRSLDLLRSDPAFIRKMVEQTVIGQQGIPEGTWRSGELNGGFPLRPPYETWRTQNEGRSNVYIRDELNGPGDGKFSEKNIAPVK
jgi:hypothetical protein